MYSSHGASSGRCATRGPTSCRPSSRARAQARRATRRTFAALLWSERGSPSRPLPRRGVCRGGQSDWPIQTSAANACTDDTANHYIAVSSAIGVRWLIIARAVATAASELFGSVDRDGAIRQYQYGTYVSIQDEVLRSLRTWPGYSGTSFVRTSVRTSAVRVTRDEVSHTRAVSYCYADCCGAFRGKVKRRFACNYPRAWQLRSKDGAALL